MTGSSHDGFEELVVGHALSALEPEDEQLLLRHLPSCAACQRELAVHQETLAHLAYAVDSADPPPGLWEGIRREVVAESGPDAFPGLVPEQGSSQVSDLSAARSRRLTARGLRERPGAWASVAAAVVAVAAVSVLGVGALRGGPDQGGTDQLAAAIRSVESAPGRTVPLTGTDGKAVAVAVVQSDKLSLILDGLPANDASSTCYVLWGQSGAAAATALATFDANGRLDLKRDLRLPPGAAMPELFVITQEAGRTAPPVAGGKALATGRAA